MFANMQRLVNNPVIGFNYDYMGYAEYEFGATGEARKYLWEVPELAAVKFSIKLGGAKNTVINDVVAFYNPEDETQVVNLLTNLESGNVRNKGFMYNESKTNLTVGWLVLYPVPVIISINHLKENTSRVKLFLDSGREKYYNP